MVRGTDEVRMCARDVLRIFPFVAGIKAVYPYRWEFQPGRSVHIIAGFQVRIDHLSQRLGIILASG